MKYIRGQDSAEIFKQLQHCTTTPVIKLIGSAKGFVDPGDLELTKARVIDIKSLQDITPKLLAWLLRQPELVMVVVYKTLSLNLIPALVQDGMDAEKIGKLAFLAKPALLKIGWRNDVRDAFKGTLLGNSAFDIQ